MKDTKFVFTKPLSKFPPDQNKPTNDVLNFNRQGLYRQRFGCALPNKVMCFTKQNTNNLTRRQIQNLFSQKTKAKPQAKMPD
jgi:hypothetical protein